MTGNWKVICLPAFLVIRIVATQSAHTSQRCLISGGGTSVAHPRPSHYFSPLRVLRNTHGGGRAQGGLRGPAPWRDGSNENVSTAVVVRDEWRRLQMKRTSIKTRVAEASQHRDQEDQAQGDKLSPRQLAADFSLSLSLSLCLSLSLLLPLRLSLSLSLPPSFL